MPRLIQTCVSGALCHSLEWGPRRNPRMQCRLGTVLDAITLSDAEAAYGLAVLVERYFPDAVPKSEASYYGA